MLPSSKCRPVNLFLDIGNCGMEGRAGYQMRHLLPHFPAATLEDDQVEQ